VYTNFLAIGSQATVTCSPPWNKEPDYVLDSEAFARRLFSMPFHFLHGVGRLVSQALGAALRQDKLDES